MDTASKHMNMLVHYMEWLKTSDLGAAVPVMPSTNDSDFYSGADLESKTNEATYLMPMQEVSFTKENSSPKVPN